GIHPINTADLLPSGGTLALNLTGPSVLRLLWHWLSRQLRHYREVAPLAGLAYALWKRRQASAAVREGRFMQQCTVLLVDVDGLRKTGAPSRVSVPTLFSKTLRALMFENHQMVELVSKAANCATADSPLLELGDDVGRLVMANIN
ncbi:unnamed protein product, partial [Polarella glacialis]